MSALRLPAALAVNTYAIVTLGLWRGFAVIAAGSFIGGFFGEPLALLCERLAKNE